MLWYRLHAMLRITWMQMRHRKTPEMSKIIATCHESNSANVGDWLLKVDLLDVDLLRLERAGLGDDDGEDAVLQASLDILGVHAGGEGPSPGEATIGPLRKPVLGLILGGFADLLRRLRSHITSLRGGGGGSSRAWRRGLLLAVLNGSLVSLGGSGGLSGLVGRGSLGALSRFRWLGLAVAMRVSTYGEGLAVLPLDIDVLAGDAREIAMEFIGVPGLADIKPGLE
jgi:hypothetical protein